MAPGRELGFLPLFFILKRNYRYWNENHTFIKVIWYKADFYTKEGLSE
jgi:hypothetical protein